MTDADEGLLADITVMTEQAATDGLTLASVFADLRLVLDLEEGDELPPAVVRRCAVTWAQVHLQADRSRIGVVGWEELESRWWPVLAGPVERVPGWALLVEPPPTPRSGAGPTLLSAEDALLGAAALLTAGLGGPGDRVAVLAGEGGAPAAVLALVEGDATRAEVAAARVAELVTTAGALRATRRRLDRDPAGAWAAVRALAGGLTQG